jgi:type IV secretion system protein VirB4
VSAAVRRRRIIDRAVASEIPYSAQIAPTVVRTYQGAYVQTFRLDGTSFECTDDDTLNVWHERLNALFRNLASRHVALWTHLIRRRESVYPEGELPPGFARELNDHYRQRLAAETLMVNEWYVSVVYRPTPDRWARSLASLLTQRDPGGRAVILRESLEVCAKLAEQIRMGLERYEPDALGLESDSSRTASRLLQFLATLVNGESQPMPLPRAPVSEVLATSRVLVGHECIEYRTPTASRLGAMLGIKEYPTQTLPGMYNRLLTVDFPFVLTQSYAFLEKSTAQQLLAHQYGRLRSAGDLAVSQAEELTGAMDALASNQFAVGDHHLTLQVMTEQWQATEDVAGERLRALNRSIETARTILGECGMVVAREDAALTAAYWAQLPGNFSFRTRKSPITSRNFAAMSAFLSYPAGRADGNHWGEALMLLKTSARSPYFFSLHASDPLDPDGGSRKDTGHTFICGPTGSGKTVFLGMCVAMLTKYGATQVVFDKDHGLEILVRALGGEYRPLKTGVPTGFNPMQLPDTSWTREFLLGFLTRLAERGDGTLTVRQSRELAAAMAGTLSLEPQVRRLSRVLEFLDPTDPEGLYARLSPWCEVAHGEYAWVFDQSEDRIATLLGSHRLVGFDVTDFLDNPVTRGPVTSYLFHLVRQLLDGRRLAVWMDEFAKLLSDRSFEAFSRDGLKTWRKMNALCGFATQSPSDVLASPIAKTLIEQTPTKVFFPNTDANPDDYIGGFGLAEREFELIRDRLEPGSRRFLVKSGHRSVVCELDLKGFDYELTVISGRARTVERVNGLISEVGADPALWLPRLRLGDYEQS